MATALQPTKKTKKYQNGLRKELFTRLQFVIAFEDDPTQLNDVSASLLESYSPRVVASCTLAWKLPKTPLNIEKYSQCMVIPGQTPYYNPPHLPSLLPDGTRNSFITIPTHSSIIPLLLTARHANVDVRNYNFVSERYSFRRLAMNDEDFVITITRLGSTVFLRCYASYQATNRNDPGYRFERMCTTTTTANLPGDYYHLIDGRIGEFRILISGETDAIRRDNGEPIELKCHRVNPSKAMQRDWWFQIFLSGINTIIHGRYSKTNRSQISHLREYHAQELSNQQAKIETFQRLYHVLQFLLSNVAENRLYMFCGHKDEATKIRSMRLYEVVDGRDKQTLTFITENLLRKLTVNA